MLAVLLSLALAAHPAPRPDTATHFTAILKADDTAPSAAMSANGAVNLNVQGNELNYQITLAGLPHVTNVVAVDEGHAIHLYDGPAVQGSALNTQGSISASNLVGEPMNELVQDLRAHKVQIVVFTTEEPGGVVRGAALPSA